MSASTPRDAYEMSYQNANRIIAALVDRGVLVEVTGGSYRRVFAAAEVFNLIRYGAAESAGSSV